MVTHNPELTRYATRVLYMHDGAIVYDEQTRLGEVPVRARSGGEAVVRSDEDEQLESLSAYLNTIPSRPAPPRKTLNPKKKKSKTVKKPRRKAAPKAKRKTPA
jgi:hypothetical protein